jgi:hypothetical protein
MEKKKMENALVKTVDTSSVIAELNSVKQIYNELMKSPHYQNLTPVGVLAIINSALSIGISPMVALNGGMHFVQGQVVMSAILMARLIRQQKHSITKDKESNDNICILHGRRADNGDTWKESFSMKDAALAGLANLPTWKKYPRVMCYNRALSYLARQLFPDVIGNCYVEGEIVEILAEDLVKETEAEDLNKTISLEQANNIDEMIGDDKEFRDIVLDFVQKRFGEASFSAIRCDAFDGIYNKVCLRAKEREKFLESAISAKNIVEEVENA